MNEQTPILLVEDDQIDAMAVRRAFRDLKFSHPLDVVENGEEALAFLRDSQRPLPGLILLDLNMSRMNGIDLLAVLKEDPSLRRIPVVVLTTSREGNDRKAAFDCGAAGYMVKGTDYNEFVESIRTIRDYWTLSEMPPGP